MSADSHSFNVELATAVGLTEAILLQHFYFWHQRACNLPDMHREGRVWFFRSVAEMREVFPYLSDANVRTAIQHLIDRGLMVKGDFASTSMYKATWYSLNDSAIQLFHLSKSTNAFLDSTNGFVDSTQSISNSKKDSSKKNSNKNNNIARFDFRAELLKIGVSEEAADAWMQVRKAKRAVNSELAFKEITIEMGKTSLTPDECIRKAVARNWCGFEAAWVNKAPTPQQAPRPAERRYLSPEERTMAALARLQARDGMLHTFNPDEQ